MKDNDIEKLYSSTLNKIKCYLKKEYGFEDIITIGSLYHKNWLTPYSDIDLVIPELDNKNFYSVLADLNEKFDVKIELLDYSKYESNEYYRNEKDIGTKNAILIRINYLISNIHDIIQHLKKLWEEYSHTDDSAYLDSFAHYITGFCYCAERIFELIYSVIDLKKNSTAFEKPNLYYILNRLGHEIKDLRPAVLQQKTIKLYNEYRLLKNLICNLNIFHYQDTKLLFYYENLDDIYGYLKNDLLAFTNLLKQQNEGWQRCLRLT